MENLNEKGKILTEDRIRFGVCFTESRRQGLNYDEFLNELSRYGIKARAITKVKENEYEEIASAFMEKLFSKTNMIFPSSVKFEIEADNNRKGIVSMNDKMARLLASYGVPEAVERVEKDLKSPWKMAPSSMSR